MMKISKQVSFWSSVSFKFQKYTIASDLLYRPPCFEQADAQQLQRNEYMGPLCE